MFLRAVDKLLNPLPFDGTSDASPEAKGGLYRLLRVEDSTRRLEYPCVCCVQQAHDQLQKTSRPISPIPTHRTVKGFRKFPSISSATSSTLPSVSFRQRSSITHTSYQKKHVHPHTTQQKFTRVDITRDLKAHAVRTKTY